MICKGGGGCGHRAGVRYELTVAKNVPLMEKQMISKISSALQHDKHP